MPGYIATNLEDAGATIGINARTLQRWIKDGCPGSKQSYSICEIVSWARENKWGSEDDMLLDSVSGAEDVKERVLRARAEKLESENKLLAMRIAAEEGRLIDIAELTPLLHQSALIYRRACEDLERKFGSDAADILRAANDESERLVDPVPNDNE